MHVYVWCVYACGCGVHVCVVCMCMCRCVYVYDCMCVRVHLRVICGVCVCVDMLRKGLHVTSTETNITVGQRTKSERKRHVTDHAVSQSDKMAGRKCPAARASKPPLFPSASISCVVVQHRKQGYISSRRSRVPAQVAVREVAACGESARPARC